MTEKRSLLAEVEGEREGNEGGLESLSSDLARLRQELELARRAAALVGLTGERERERGREREREGGPVMGTLLKNSLSLSL